MAPLEVEEQLSSCFVEHFALGSEKSFPHGLD